MKASEWAFDRKKEASDLVAQDEARKVSIVQEIMIRKYRLPATCHLASWRRRRSHNVLLVSALQQFLLGRLHLVGLLGKTHRLVVRNLRREIRLKATDQAFSRSNR